jgi:hypothetical protein
MFLRKKSNVNLREIRLVVMNEKFLQIITKLLTKPANQNQNSNLQNVKLHAFPSQ